MTHPRNLFAGSIEKPGFLWLGLRQKKTRFLRKIVDDPLRYWRRNLGEGPACVQDWWLYFKDLTLSGLKTRSIL